MKIVFDLDGTLADGAHREHLIRGETKDWDAYFAASDRDTGLPGLEVLRSLWYAPAAIERTGPKEHQIEIWPGRGEGPGGAVRQKTLTWIRDRVHVGLRDAPPAQFFNAGLRGEVHVGLRMRGHTDYTPDDQLKRGWLKQARAAGLTPDLVFDDRDRVVAMWREEGIPCFQVAPGAF